MRSAVELREGDLVLRMWTEADARAVALTPASPVIGEYFGLPFDGAPDPDPNAPAFTIVAGGIPVGRIWCAAGRRPFEIGYFLRPETWRRGLAVRSLRLLRDWLLAQGETTIVLCTHPDNDRSLPMTVLHSRDGAWHRTCPFGQAAFAGESCGCGWRVWAP
jgi:hypothetical protein